MDRYNLIVLGGGSGGLMVAAGAAGLGARVALVESGKMGGECLNTGCIPSKALLRSAQTARTKRSALHGLPAAPVDTSWAAIAARVRGVIRTIAPHDSVERFTALGVDVVQGRGRLVSATAVEVALNAGGTRRLEGKAVVLSTGSRPAVPPIPGLPQAGYLTNETVFEQLAEFDRLGQPPRIAVLGGGPIGAELAQALARLGARVTLLEALGRLLPREDADAADIVTASLREDGVEVLTATRATGVENLADCRRMALDGAGGPRSLDVDRIIVATGRAPNAEDLGLKEAGVAYGAGGVTVDDRMRTTSPSVFACGDVAGPYQFTHMANQQARVVIQNALFPVPARMDYRAVPWCTFTDPELAQVGPTEAQARERGIPTRALRVDFADVDRAVCDGEPRGFLKVLTPPGRDDILGATLVGAHAGELIHEILAAMRGRMRLRDLAGMVHIYPTLAEAIRRLGDESRKAGFTPALQGWVRRYLAWQRS
jgi:pyruvate/2-oxoglutarate dehydrogenase complex dihydrolipoamide dehydrogenase (E3) component